MKCRCGATMENSELYTYECPVCGFKYKMHPADPKKSITVLREGKVSN